MERLAAVVRNAHAEVGYAVEDVVRGLRVARDRERHELAHPHDAAGPRAAGVERLPDVKPVRPEPVRGVARVDDECGEAPELAFVGPLLVVVFGDGVAELRGLALDGLPGVTGDPSPEDGAARVADKPEVRSRRQRLIAAVVDILHLRVVRTDEQPLLEGEPCLAAVVGDADVAVGEDSDDARRAGNLARLVGRVLGEFSPGGAAIVGAEEADFARVRVGGADLAAHGLLRCADVEALRVVQVEADVRDPRLLKPEKTPGLAVVVGAEDTVPVLSADEHVGVGGMAGDATAHPATVAVAVEAGGQRAPERAPSVARDIDAGGFREAVAGGHDERVGVARVDGERADVVGLDIAHGERHVGVEGLPRAAAIVRAVRSADIDVGVPAHGIRRRDDDILDEPAAEDRQDAPGRVGATGGSYGEKSRCTPDVGETTGRTF